MFGQVLMDEVSTTKTNNINNRWALGYFFNYKSKDWKEVPHGELPQQKLMLHKKNSKQNE